MPVVVAIGAALGASAIGGALTGVIGAVAAETIGGAIGGALAGGVTSVAQGGDFDDGFKAGALGGVIQGGLGALTSNLAGSSTAETIGVGPEPAMSATDAIASSEAGMESAYKDVASPVTGQTATETLLGNKLPQIEIPQQQPVSLVDLTTQQPTATGQTPTVAPTLQEQVQTAQAQQAGVAPGLSSLGQTNSAVKANQFGNQSGLADILKQTMGKKSAADLGGSVFDMAMRGSQVADAKDRLSALQNKYNAGYGELNSLGNSMISNAQNSRAPQSQRIQAILAKWGAGR